MISDSTHPLHFVTSVYGHAYGGMLLNLLYSITVSHPNAAVTVFWQDIGGTVMHLKRAFPQYMFSEVTHMMGCSSVERIAKRTALYEAFIGENPGGRIIFIDTDMIVLKSLNHFFDDQPFDIAFTFKDETYPLNLGILLVNGSPKTAAFMRQWASETAKIFDDPELLRMATLREYGYGAPDQMSFNRILSFSTRRMPNERYVVHIDSEEIILQGIPCRLLNETNSAPVTNATHIIHYKAGWHSILIHGTGFTPRRPKKDSWEMYILYLSTYRRALAYVNKRLNAHFSESNFGITLPWYLDANLKERPIWYMLFAAKERIVEPFRIFVMRFKRWSKRHTFSSDRAR